MTSRIKSLEQEARVATAQANEAREILGALRSLMGAAGVSRAWAEPEPRGVDYAFATIVSSLTSESGFSRSSVEMAARDLIDEFVGEEF